MKKINFVCSEPFAFKTYVHNLKELIFIFYCQYYVKVKPALKYLAAEWNVAIVPVCVYCLDDPH